MIEVLNPDEWERIPREAFGVSEEPMPVPKESMIFTTRRGGEIIALCGLQHTVCVSPFWVKKDLRGTGLALEMAECAARVAPLSMTALMVTTNPHMEQIAFKVGMTPLLGKLWRRDAR